VGFAAVTPVLKLKTPSQEQVDSGKVIFWDLDHTLYPKASGVYSDTVVKVYIMERLGLSERDAEFLFKEYDREYDGHVLKGLILDYQVDPNEFETWIDNKVNLEGVLKPDENVKKLLKKSKARNWIITNSGLDHATRVLKALEMEDLFEAMIYLDYDSPNSPTLKPEPRSFLDAMKYAEIGAPSDCILVDDIKENARGACLMDWQSVHLCEPRFCIVENPIQRLWKRSDGQCDVLPTITYLQQMPSVYPSLFKI
jgi:pyrimidine and pyridine-specific 5'-nucleotidase